MSDGGELDPEAFLRVVGKRIRILRLTRELTQDELAAAAGISRSFVSLVEHGAKGGGEAAHSTVDPRRATGRAGEAALSQSSRWAASGAKAGTQTAT